MESIGERLRAVREDRKITLQEAAARTRIHERYLEALEDERYGVLPASTYVSAFLRTYARFLGIDEDEALSLYHRDKTERDEDETLWTDDPVEVPETPPRKVVIAVSAVIVVVAAVVYYYVLR